MFDIRPDKEAMPRVFTRRKHLRIDDLNDPEAHKMTHFFHGQLRQLCRLFDLEGYLQSIDEEEIPLYTGHFRGNTPCRYMIDPEELFLFTLCKVATGRTNQSIIDEYFGGDYTRWGYGYPWMLRYIDDRYEDIIGHQGLTRFLRDFARFNRAIERFVQKDCQRELSDGAFEIVWGLEFLPFDIFGFIDNSIGRISTPFSGLQEDYASSAQRAQYANTQRAFYSGC